MGEKGQCAGGFADLSSNFPRFSVITATSPHHPFDVTKNPKHKKLHFKRLECTVGSMAFFASAGNSMTTGCTT